jgi:hypothetical protein
MPSGIIDLIGYCIHISFRLCRVCFILCCTISSHGAWHPDIRLDRCAVGEKNCCVPRFKEEDQDGVEISVFATNIQLVRPTRQSVENVG